MVTFILDFWIVFLFALALESIYVVFQVIIRQTPVIFRFPTLGVNRTYYSVIGLSSSAFNASFSAMLNARGIGFTQNGKEWLIVSRNVTVRAKSFLNLGSIHLSVLKKDAPVLKEIVTGLREHYQTTSVATNPLVPVIMVMLVADSGYTCYTDTHNVYKAIDTYAQDNCKNKLWNEATGLGLVQQEYQKSHPGLMAQCIKDQREENLRLGRAPAAIDIEDPCLTKMWKEADQQGIGQMAYTRSHEDVLVACEAHMLRDIQAFHITEKAHQRCATKMWNEATQKGEWQDAYIKHHPERMQQCESDTRMEFIRTNNHMPKIDVEDTCLVRFNAEAKGQGVDTQAYIKANLGPYVTCESDLLESHRHK